MQRRLGLIVVAVIVSISSVAQAVNSHNILIFRPTFDRSPFFSVSDARVLGHLEWSANFLTDYASNPLFVGGSKRGKGPVGAVVSTHLAAGIGLADHYEIGFNFPFVPFESYYDILTAVRSDQYGMLGDPRLEGKVGILNPDDFAVGLALHPFLQLPLGKSERFVGDGGLAGGGELAISQTFLDRLDVGVNVGVNIRNKATVLNVISDDQLIYSLGLGLRATDAVSIITEARGTTLLSNFWGKESGRPIDSFGGVRIVSPETGLGLSIGGGFGYMNSVSSVDYRGFAGFSWSPPLHREPTFKEEQPTPRPQSPPPPKPEPKPEPKIAPKPEVKEMPQPKPQPKKPPKKQEEKYDIYVLPE